MNVKRISKEESSEGPNKKRKRTKTSVIQEFFVTLALILKKRKRKNEWELLRVGWVDFSVKLRAAVVRGVSQIRIVFPTFLSRYFRRRVHKTHFTILLALFSRAMAINSTLLHCNTHNGRMVKWVSWEFQVLSFDFFTRCFGNRAKTRLLLCSRWNQNCQHYYRGVESWYVRGRADFVHKECLMFNFGMRRFSLCFSRAVCCPVK